MKSELEGMNRVTIMDKEEIAQLIAENLYSMLQNDFVASGTQIMTQEVLDMKQNVDNQITEIKESMDTQISEVKESIDINKQDIEDKVETIKSDMIGQVHFSAYENEIKDQISEVKETIDINKQDIEDKVETMKSDMIGQVYFSAYDDESGSAFEQLKFPTVVLNRGEAFDGDSGVFTAPYRGTYSFSFSGQQGDHSENENNNMVVYVKKNGVTVFNIYDDENTNNEFQRFQNIHYQFELLLEENDKITLETEANNDILYASGTARLTFSGHLLFAA